MTLQEKGEELLSYFTVKKFSPYVPLKNSFHFIFCPDKLYRIVKLARKNKNPNAFVHCYSLINVYNLFLFFIFYFYNELMCFNCNH